MLAVVALIVIEPAHAQRIFNDCYPFCNYFQQRCLDDAAGSRFEISESNRCRNEYQECMEECLATPETAPSPAPTPKPTPKPTPRRAPRAAPSKPRMTMSQVLANVLGMSGVSPTVDAVRDALRARGAKLGIDKRSPRGPGMHIIETYGGHGYQLTNLSTVTYTFEDERLTSVSLLRTRMPRAHLDTRIDEMSRWMNVETRDEAVGFLRAPGMQLSLTVIGTAVRETYEATEIE